MSEAKLTMNDADAEKSARYIEAALGILDRARECYREMTIAGIADPAAFVEAAKRLADAVDKNEEADTIPKELASRENLSTALAAFRKAAGGE